VLIRPCEHTARLTRPGILLMLMRGAPMEANVAGIWWSYAKADPTLLGTVVVLVALAAVGFVVVRALAARARRRR
jgi:hypothetical protein